MNINKQYRADFSNYSLKEIYENSIKLQEHNFIQEALDGFHYSADNGYLDSQVFLGEFFAYQVPQEKLSYHYYDLASKQGNERSRYIISLYMLKGIGCNQNATDAFLKMKSLADEGIDYAILDLALFYKNGIGCIQSNVDAFNCFERAANMGSNVGLFDLGSCYYFGMGVEKNIKKAIDYYEQSAKLGNIDALYNMGALLWEGEGFVQNKDSAIKCMLCAAQLGSEKASDFLKKLGLNHDQLETVTTMNIPIELKD